MNRDIDYAPNRYVIMEITEDGPSRLQGHVTYPTWEDARSGATNYLRKGNGHKRVTVLKIEADFWLDPLPDLKTNRAETP